MPKVMPEGWVESINVWWVWILAGLGLLVLEIVTPGLVLMFFGVAALLVGTVLWVGILMPAWATLLAFSVLSIVLLLAFRGPLMRRMGSLPGDPPRIDRLEDEVATALQDIAAGSVGRAELRGTTWAARNVDEISIPQGSRCRVVRVDGLTLLVSIETAA
jgi:membrane protein implicated in regulation of membrane protease activity